jgi:2-polyprenyl-3-methyl-5-hydroxy-6-metoxy-1,4-benzoquinol methylase
MKSISLYKFGGSDDVVRRIQGPYVEFFRSAGPVLDIGCGRGIFLELLAKAGIEAVGVDASQAAVAACQEKGFKVHCESAQSYLRRSPNQFGGIFCSHVIEHLGYDDALNTLELCYNALHPGGQLLVITPNAQDLEVIAEMFWLDPTHVRPYPKPLLKSMLEAVGFHIKLEKQYLGTWRMLGRRNLPVYLFRRFLLGKYFGKPNTLMLATKESHSI